MNERFRELAKKAGIQITHMVLDGVEYDYEDVSMDGSEDLQKFAELLVRECIGCCEQVISDPVPKSVDTFEQGGIHCMDEIKEHFGVEE